MDEIVRTGGTETVDGTAGAGAAFPVFNFNVPKELVAPTGPGFCYALFGKDTGGNWKYWDADKSAYESFGSSSGMNTTCLNQVSTNSFAIQLPSSDTLVSGVAALFAGSSNGIPVTSGVPGTPTLTTNPNDHFGIFEITYTAPSSGGTGQSLDIDISNVDQIGLTFTVASSSAPYPLAEVGIPITQSDLVAKYQSVFSSGSPFLECLNTAQNQLVAPQDVLAAVTAPNALSYLAPGGTPPANTQGFLEHCYYYMVSETTSSGETAASPSAFGGFLLGKDGSPTASKIALGWQRGASPVKYIPTNPQATGINIYRAPVAPTNAEQPIPKAPDRASFELLVSMSIDAWNQQPGYCYEDDAVNAADPTERPKSNSYGFSPLSKWFDTPLKSYFEHYINNTFWVHQTSQISGEANGTLWTGKVLKVTPNQGAAITSQTYISKDGKQKSIDATWAWGDGSASYYVLQLVGNAYDAANLSNYQLATGKTYTAGEYEGAVLNIYVPYFVDNCGAASLDFPAGQTAEYTLPPAPAWMTNAQWPPSAQVFGCTGVFATGQDPDALSQESAFVGLATDALTNLENVIVSALNRGICETGTKWLDPMQYTSAYQFSKEANVVSTNSEITQVPPGVYTYALSGVLPNGAETALSWSQTVLVEKHGFVELQWLPQSASLYTQALIYRKTLGGSYERVGEVSNSSDKPATGFKDTNGSLEGTPITFYPVTPTAVSNLYSGFLHKNYTADPMDGISLNGLVYGYPFDDQGSFSTNINYGSALPSSITFTVIG